MSEIKADVLRRQIKNASLDRCYLLYGSEHYLQEHYARELRKAVLGGEDDAFNLRQLDGRNLDLQALLEAVEAYPSFAEKTLVEVRDFNFYQSTKKKEKEKEEEEEDNEEAAEQPEQGDIKELIAILSDLPEYCCLVFLYDTLDFKPDTRRKKVWDQLKKLITLVEFPLQGQQELVRWIQKHFAARDREIGAEDAAYMLFLCSSQMENLTNEIGKVAVYAREKQVRREDIDAVVVPVFEAQVFKMTDALAAKEYDRAAELMYHLFQLNMAPIAINAIIGGQLRKLYTAFLLKKAGGNSAELSKLLGIQEYAARLNLRICTSFPESWYLRMIRLCAETDFRMKSSQGDPEDLVRSMFVTMAAEA